MKQDGISNGIRMEAEWNLDKICMNLNKIWMKLDESGWNPNKNLVNLDEM